MPDRTMLPLDEINKEIEQNSIVVNKGSASIFGLISEDIEANTKTPDMKPYIVLKYYQSSWQCFSELSKANLKDFSKFLKKLENYTWQEIINQSGSTGLGYKEYKISSVSKKVKSKFESFAQTISEDIIFSEFRLGGKFRIHGFKYQSAFFLVFLDKNHEVFP